MKLALFGGKPLRSLPFPPHKTTGQEEINGALEVLKTGFLSCYEGSNNEWFLGGPEVQALENEWANYFECKHAVAVNSATSGLYAAVAAAEIGPGDEVITTPWTMAATATSIVANHAVPIFADIDLETYCISAQDIERKITPRTRAILPVHIYGHPADMTSILKLARKHNLVVIEDAAQSPGARYQGTLTGSIGDMGVHSLNGHKLIQCGEGGMITTNDDDLAHRLKLIRNHAESVIATGMKVKSLVNMVGWNFRMNEIEARISRIQLTKLKPLQEERNALAHYLSDRLKQFPGLLLPAKKKDCDHTYYRYPVRLDPEKILISAKTLVDALNAEGLDWMAGYLPINMYPMYQEQIAIGKQGCPFKCSHYEGTPDYSMKTLPNVSRLLQTSLSTENVRPPLAKQDMEDMVQGFEKIFENMNSLNEYELELNGSLKL